MSNRIDTRKKIARQDGQEYAHIYPFDGQNETYQYPNDEQRVTYHAKDPDDSKGKDELYNVQPEPMSVDALPETNIPKVKFDPSKTVEDHRQRSYRIKNKPQIYDKSDPGQEAYRLQNDPRQDEVEKTKETMQNLHDQISREQSIDLTSPSGRFGLDNDDQPSNDYADDSDDMVVEIDIFEPGDDVEDSDMGLKGKVAFVGRNVISVLWNDNTRERMNLYDASKFLKKSYVDAAQEQVDPLDTTPYPKSRLEKTINNALSSVEAGDDGEVDNDIDIEKVKLQRKVNELQATVNDINIQKIKEKAAKEIVDLMQKKGMLGKSEDEVELQMAAIMAMNDEAFESYKQAIVGTKTASNEVAEIEALLGNDDYSDIEDGQEYAMAREAMKKASPPARSVDGIEMGDTSFFENGGLASNFRPRVGDFSSQLSLDGSSDATPRKLAASAQDRKMIQRKADSGLDLSGFQNLQGLTTPINIPNKDLTAGSKFADLFGDMGWSGLPKGGSSRRR